MPGARHGGAVVVGDHLPVVIHLDVGDAVVVDKAAHHGTQPVQAVTATLADAGGQLAPGRADVARGVDQLVVAGTHAIVAHLEQRTLGPGTAVGGHHTVHAHPAAGGT